MKCSECTMRCCTSRNIQEELDMRRLVKQIHKKKINDLQMFFLSRTPTVNSVAFGCNVCLRIIFFFFFAAVNVQNPWYTAAPPLTCVCGRKLGPQTEKADKLTLLIAHTNIHVEHVSQHLDGSSYSNKIKQEFDCPQKEGQERLKKIARYTW